MVEGRVPDSSGNNNHGTVHGATLVKGVVGSGISFVKAKGTYVDCGADASLNVMAGDFTIMFWVKASADSGGYIIARGNAESGRHGYWQFGRKGPGGHVVWVTRGMDKPVMGNFAPSIDFRSTATVFDGTWHHAALTKKGVTATWYVDGARDVARALAPKYTEIDNLILGQLMVKRGNIYNWTGALDELRMYSRALSADEIKKRYDTDRRGLAD